jgi:hypothetical protein
MIGLYLYNLPFLLLYSGTIFAAAYIKFVKYRAYVIGLYIISLCVIFYICYQDYDHYTTFNNLSTNDIIDVKVDGKSDTMLKEVVFDFITKDELSFVNHPKIEKELIMEIETKAELYKFRIWKTSNQGILITRYRNGHQYITHKNSTIYHYMQKYF